MAHLKNYLNLFGQLPNGSTDVCTAPSVMGLECIVIVEMRFWRI